MSATAIVGLAPTILGPLTTVFTPPPACTVAVGQVSSGGGLLGLGGLLGGGSPAGNFAFLGQTCSDGQPADATACWPATSAGAPPPPAPSMQGWGAYSPGVECPAGYATACAATAGGASGWPLQFRLTAGETAVGCCPSGYGCANIGGQTCTMIATSTVVPTVSCDGNKVGALAFNTVPDTAAQVTAFSLYAPMIQINFQSSDLPAAAAPGPTAGTFTTRTTTTVSAGAPSPTASSSTSSSSSPQSQTSSQEETSSTSQQAASTATSSEEQLETAPPPTTTAASALSPPSTTADLQTADAAADTTNTSSSGFPRMAAVGIGVGGGVAALLIGGSALLYCVRRRRSQREDRELDRLYGLGKLDSVTGSSRGDEFPGFYRGQMPTVPGGARQMHF